MNRRRFLAVGAVGAGASLLTGCSFAPSAGQLREVLASAEGLTMWLQRALLFNGALAREFTEADLSPTFRANGTTFPETDRKSVV